MVTLDATSLSNLVDTSLAAATAENIIDAAINRIAGYGYTIVNLTGTAGTKTLTVTQAELGWVQSVAVAIYAREYKNSGSTSQSVSANGLSSSSSMNRLRSVYRQTGPWILYLA